jgi:hypothetical protein
MQGHRFSLVAHSRDLDQLIEKTKGYIRGAKSPATLRVHRSDFEDFTSFCREHSLPRLPTSPSTVALYISDCAGGESGQAPQNDVRF